MCERISCRHAGARFERRALLVALGGFALGACTRGRSPRGWGRRACAPASAPWAASGVAVAASPPAATAPVARPAVPHARTAAPGYEFVPRAEWGAEPLRDNHDPMTPITRLTIHHTHTLEDMDPTDDVQAMQAIQRFHQDERGWADVGYHYVVGRDGRVYEGRPTSVQGAHAGADNNIGNLGVSVMGSFGAALPAPRQLATVERLLRDLVERHAIPAGGLFAHREFKATECPGDALHAWFCAWREARPSA